MGMEQHKAHVGRLGAFWQTRLGARSQPQGTLVLLRNTGSGYFLWDDMQNKFIREGLGRPAFGPFPTIIYDICKWGSKVVFVGGFYGSRGHNVVAVDPVTLAQVDLLPSNPSNNQPICAAEDRLTGWLWVGGGVTGIGSKFTNLNAQGIAGLAYFDGSDWYQAPYPSDYDGTSYFLSLFPDDTFGGGVVYSTATATRSNVSLFNTDSSGNAAEIFAQSFSVYPTTFTQYTGGGAFNPDRTLWQFDGKCYTNGLFSRDFSTTPSFDYNGRGPAEIPIGGAPYIYSSIYTGTGFEPQYLFYPLGASLGMFHDGTHLYLINPSIASGNKYRNSTSTMATASKFFYRYDDNGGAPILHPDWDEGTPPFDIVRDAVYHNGRLFVIARETGTGSTSAVYCQEDDASWTQLLPSITDFQYARFKVIT